MLATELFPGMIFYNGSKLLKVIELLPDYIKCKYVKTGYSLNISSHSFNRASHRYTIATPDKLLKEYKSSLRKQTQLNKALEEITEALGPYAIIIAENKIKQEISKTKK